MNKSICREDYPGYMGHIPLKTDVNIGMTVGATNEMIKKIVTSEPQKEDVLIGTPYDDYSYYNKDYFNKTFSKESKNILSRKIKYIQITVKMLEHG
jgi:hypothetical protein